MSINKLLCFDVGILFKIVIQVIYIDKFIEFSFVDFIVMKLYQEFYFMIFFYLYKQNYKLCGPTIDSLVRSLTHRLNRLIGSMIGLDFKILLGNLFVYPSLLYSARFYRTRLCGFYSLILREIFHVKI